MKFVFVYISLFSISTLLYAKENNPFSLSNIHIIERNTHSFLDNLKLVSKRQKELKMIKKQLALEIQLAKKAKKEQKILEAKQLEEETKRKKLLVKKQHKKIIYLTFDDGPLRGTENVLKVLKEEEINATMFFVGKHIRKNKRLFKKALSMTNLCISNHTYSHANEKYAHFYSNLNHVIYDVDKSQKMIGKTKYLRLAGRNIWRLPNICKNDYAISKKQRKVEIPKYDALADRGYQIYGWDVEWNFNHHTGRPAYGVETIFNKIENQYKRGKISKKGKIILLSHDYMFRGEEGALKLRTLIHKLKVHDWVFKSLEEYINPISKPHTSFS